MGRRVVAAVAVLGALALSACGGDGGSSGGAPTLNWYVFEEPSGSFEEAAKRCSDANRGKWSVKIVPLPTNADQQRELLVRRLAAEDEDIDIMGMDVIWTAEFAEADWLLPWKGEAERTVTAGVLDGPLRTARYQDKLWVAPFTSNTQLLWYRKDRVPRPPATWDEMIEQAKRIGAQGKIQVQGAQYEGYTVWFNSLVQSAGGEIVTEDGEIADSFPQAGRRAAEIMSRLSKSSAAPTNLNTTKEDEARLAFQTGDSSFMVNYGFVYPSAKEEAPEVFKNMGVAPWPRVRPDQPARVTLGGINLGVSAYSQNPREAFEAATCLRQRENQIAAAVKGGLAPISGELYQDPEIKKAFPFADQLEQGIRNGSPRPVTPAYADVSLAIQRTLHPPDSIDPGTVIETLSDRLRTAGDGGLF